MLVYASLRTSTNSCNHILTFPIRPHSLGFNHDNGALHWLLLERFYPRGDTHKGDPSLFEAAMEAGRHAWNLQTYYPFLLAFHEALHSTGCTGGEWTHIHIIPPGKSWQYDGYMTGLEPFARMITRSMIFALQLRLLRVGFFGLRISVSQWVTPKHLFLHPVVLPLQVSEQMALVPAVTYATRLQDSLLAVGMSVSAGDQAKDKILPGM